MDIDQRQRNILFSCIVLASLLLTLVSYLLRPLSPVNETLYTGVAWDMFAHHHYLVPLVDGHTYNQKPPLFFWLLDFGWSVFGINNWWPMLLPTLCSLASVFLTASIARQLFPQHKHIYFMTALILLSMAYWFYYMPRARLDQLLTLCVMLSLYGLVKAIRQQPYALLWFGVGNGLALLTKGPICFIFTMVPLITAYFTFKEIQSQKARWFGFIFASFILSLAIVALWALPIIINNPEYAKSILWDQTADRLAHSHDVQIKVWYYYLIRLPLLIMPWICWPALWQGFKNTQLKDNPHFKWLCLSSLSIFVILSLAIAQKGSRFLIPFMPFVAIIFAYVLHQTQKFTQPRLYQAIGGVLIGAGILLLLAKPLLTHWPQLHAQTYYHGLWGLLPLTVGLLWFKYASSHQRFTITILIALSSCSVTFVLYGIAQHMDSPRENMQPIGLLIHRLQKQHHPIAFMGTYDDRFQFAGHIKQPITSLENKRQLTQWVTRNPHGYVIKTINIKDAKTNGLRPLFQQPYRHKQLVQLWQASTFMLDDADNTTASNHQ